MPRLHPNELEFSIETNAFVPAERALKVGSDLLVFLRQPEILGSKAEIRLAHLGQGSLVARIFVVLRDPATAGAAAILGAAIAGVTALKDGNGSFPESIAHACIESNALRCGFRVDDQEFFVERDQMPAVERAKANIASGVPISLPPAGYAYLTSDGRYLMEGDDFVIGPLPVGRSGANSDVAETVSVGAKGDDPRDALPENGDSASQIATNYEVDYLTTEDGEIVTTEGGDPIEVGSSKQVHESRDMGNRDSIVRLDGHFFTGTSNYVFHALDGRRFEVLFRGETQGPPTATPVSIVARYTDIRPREGLVESVLLLDRWDRRDNSDRSDEAGAFESDREENGHLEKVFGPLSENEFFAVGHIRKSPGVAYFDANDGKGYRIENVDAVRKIRSGELAAVLEQRGKPVDDGPPRVWLARFQTAPYNLDE